MRLNSCDCNCCFECTGIRTDGDPRANNEPDDGVRMPEPELRDTND